jgi:hypothetical protein
MTTASQRLRLIWLLLLSLLCATTGSFGAEVGYDGRAGCAFAAKDASKVFSKEKQALVDMANADKRTGMTKADMEAYKELNKQLPDPFPANKVRGPEAHPSPSPHSQQPHGHVGPIDYIPMTDAN